MSPSVGAQPIPTQQPSQLPTTIIQNTTTTYQQHHHLQKDQVPAAANTTTALTTTEVCNKSNITNSNNTATDINLQQQQQHHNQTNPSRSQSLTSITTASSVSQPIHTITTNISSNSSNNTLVPSHPATTSITQHQFITVHGSNHHFLGSNDHSGPAPNVTVNPHYQPSHGDPNPRPIPMSSSLNTSSAVADQQIRVLTPSEIMRTLPSLCQEGYEPPPPLPILVRAPLVQSKTSLNRLSVILFFDFHLSFFIHIVFFNYVYT